MKCAVIYYTQTGNTEKVAKAIQKGIQETGSECDLLKIRDVDPTRLSGYDLIGIGSPAFGVEPTNVSKFVEDMRFVGGKHAFIFCTHGTHPENFFPSIYPKVRNRQLVVIGMANWYGNCFLLHMPEPYPTIGHPDEVDLEEAVQFGKDMVERSLAVSGGDTSGIPAPPLPPPPPPPDLPVGPDAHLEEGEKNIVECFSEMLVFHKEKCRYPKCRLCMDNCPVMGIDLSMDPPVLAEPCLMCEFCTRVCPTGALDMDEWVAAVSEETGKIFERFLMSAIDQAETEGKFRRLMPKEELKLDTYGYMVHKKHPSWIVGRGPR